MLGLDPKEILAVLAMIIGVLSYGPYLRSVWKGRTRPHMFSWVIWGLLTGIAFFAQIADDAGPGAWVTGFTAILTFIVIALAFKHGEKNITRSDMMTFAAGLAAIPVWLATDNALWAVLIVTVIDALGFYPTFRKSWHKPHEELALSYFLSGLKFAISLPALHNVSVITVIYPLSLVLTNWVFVVMLYVRRRSMESSAA
ncbi:MAG: hypothetical protein H6867_03745 [Rhodospirillales bacterium]|nr:hypothetical protein [Rhodospirillales bacterium]MCB9996263.1 hypothetical protein [Rhodospirillales bacterium]